MDELRKKGGKKAAIVAIGANCILTILNVSVGMLCGSYALVSEGAHTLSDIVTSIIAYVGFYIGQKPADNEHPIGHGRAEAISGLAIVVFLAIVGWEILQGSVDRILHPSLITVPETPVAIMAVFGIFINLIVSRYIIDIGRQIKSPAIVADGKHQRTDIFSSIVILVGVIVSNIGFPILDPIIAMLISCLVFKTAYEIGKENIDNIMGKVPSEDFIQRIKEVAESIPEVENAHEIKVDYMGSYAIVSLHIQLDGAMTLNESHKYVHIVQNKILKEIPEIKYVMAHACPIGLTYNHEQKIDY